MINLRYQIIEEQSTSGRGFLQCLQSTDKKKPKQKRHTSSALNPKWSRTSTSSSRKNTTNRGDFAGCLEVVLKRRASVAGALGKQCISSPQTVTDLCTQACQPSCYTSSAGDDCALKRCAASAPEVLGTTNMNDWRTRDRRGAGAGSGEVARKKKEIQSGDKGGVTGSEWRGSSEVRRVGERVEKVGCNPWSRWREARCWEQQGIGALC